jgi:hypothetical protein
MLSECDLLREGWHLRPDNIVRLEGGPPHCVMVEARGNRFGNESESYVDLGHHMVNRSAITT